MTLFDGIWSYTDKAWAAGPISYTGEMRGSWNPLYGRNANGPQSLNFVLANLGSSIRPSSYVKAYMGSAVVQLTDPDKPSVTRNSVSGPTGWTKDGTWTVNGAASDSGLGVKRLRLLVPSTALGGLARLDRGKNLPPGCLGTNASPCPSAYDTTAAGNTPFSFSATDSNGNPADGDQPMPDGINTIKLNAADPLAADDDSAATHQAQDTTGTVKVDRTGPALSNLTGSLWARAGKTLTQPTYSVDVDATDPLSGSKSVALVVDGAVVAEKPVVCSTAAQCPSTASHATLALTTASLTDGEHEIKVVGRDLAGNETDSTPANTWTVIVGDFSAPDAMGGGTLGDHNGDFLNGRLTDLVATADDGEGSGVKRLYIDREGTTDHQEVAATCSPECPQTLSNTFTIDTRSLPEGPVTWIVGSEDQAGNSEPQDRITVFIDRTPPTPPDRIVLDRDPNTDNPRLDWREGTDPAGVANEPAASEIAVTEFRFLRNGAWSAWDYNENSDTTVTGFSTGDQVTVELRTRDYAGNISGSVSRTLTVPPPTPSEATNRAAGGASNPQSVCDPRMDYIRPRTTKPNFTYFKEVQTVLGGQLAINCRTDVGFDPNVKITGQLAFHDGDNKYRAVGKEFTTSFRAKRARDVKVRGFNAVCTAARAGKRDYIIVGQLTYKTEAGITREPMDYNTDPDDAESQSCPTARTRRAREVAGWIALTRTRPDGTPVKKAPSAILKETLGQIPYAPKGATRPWDAHHIIPATDSRAAAQQALGFRCAIHPNERVNGVYLRGSGLRKTVRGKTNPYYGQLKSNRPDLAKRTYHGDTFGPEYFSKLASATNMFREDNEETCPVDDALQLRNILDRVSGQLVDGTFINGDN